MNKIENCYILFYIFNDKIIIIFKFNKNQKLNQLDI